MGGAVSRFGDIHQALGYRWTPTGEETLFLRSKVLVDARAAGIRYPISGMWGGAVDDVDGLRAWAASLRDLGYYGMMIGDPAHVPLVHEMFTPTPDEIAYWLELDRLATEAERAGHGTDRPWRPQPGRGARRPHRAHRVGAHQPRVGARPRLPLIDGFSARCTTVEVVQRAENAGVRRPSQTVTRDSRRALQPVTRRRVSRSSAM